MSAAVRSPKIPLSPSSPPETGLKRRRQSDSTEKPPTPPYMSVATKSYVSSYGHTSHSDETASRSSPRSPSSSSSYAQQATQRDSQAYSTPASSTGIPGLSMTEDSDQHRNKRQKMELDTREAPDMMQVDQSTRPTNHERNEHVDTSFSVDSDDTSLDQLQKDMGDAFLLGRSKPLRQGPKPESHLLGNYGLVPLLRTVARTDPVTGEKINKLRKSYEGQIKAFGFSGRNKTIKRDRLEIEASKLRQSIGSGLKDIPEDPNEAPGPLQTDEEWNATHAQVKVAVTSDFRAKLKKAMELQPGRVRNVEHWDDVLGHDKPRTVAPMPVQQAPPSGPQRIPNGVSRPQSYGVAEIKRQTRGKKRSYGDDSFIGYGDGYSDVEDSGAIDYGDDEGGSRRKRRKESIGGPLTYGQMQGR